jgi:hypothetical protein
MRYVQAPAEPKRHLGPTTVHEEDCYVVIKVWPNLNYQPHPGPATCGHCINRAAMRGT